MGQETTDAGGGAKWVRAPRARIEQRTADVKRRLTGTSAYSVWDRLHALDFIQQAMIFAAILLLAFLPFLIVISALAGRNVVTGLSRQLGLNHQASEAVRRLFNSSTTTSNAVTVQGIIFSVLGGIGTASTLQGIYERLYRLKSRGIRDFHRQLIWIAAVIGGAVVIGWAGPHLRHLSAGPLLLGVTSFAFGTVFWLFTVWLLVSDRVPVRDLAAPAVATSAFWIGLGVFSKFFLSNTVIGDSREYGSIGVVFALMTWLIAVGVVIILGAVVGIVWREHDLSFSGALKRLIRPRRHRKLTDRPSEARGIGPAASALDLPGADDPPAGESRSWKNNTT